MNVITILFKLIAYQGAITQAWKILGPIVGELVGGMATNAEVRPADLLSEYNMAWVQTTLRTPGLLGGSPDLVVTGEYGDQGGPTDLATRAFQTAHPPLLVDGIPGLLTSATLKYETDKLRAEAA